MNATYVIHAHGQPVSVDQVGVENDSTLNFGDDVNKKYCK